MTPQEIFDLFMERQVDNFENIDLVDPRVNAGASYLAGLADGIGHTTNGDLNMQHIEEIILMIAELAMKEIEHEPNETTPRTH